MRLPGIHKIGPLAGDLSAAAPDFPSIGFDPRPREGATNATSLVVGNVTVSIHVPVGDQVAHDLLGRRLRHALRNPCALDGMFCDLSRTCDAPLKFRRELAEIVKKSGAASRIFYSKRRTK